MSKKLILDAEYLAEYCIIGIAYHFNDYRLSFHLNKALNICLKKTDNFNFRSIKGKLVQNFSFANFTDNENRITYFLISNHGDNGLLVPSLKQIDYFIFIQGFENLDKSECFPNGSESLLQLIRSIPNIIAAYEIKSVMWKDMDVLLTEMELHMLEMEKLKKK